MHFIHGFCSRNGMATVVEYWQRVPNRTVPHRNMFYCVHRSLRERDWFLPINKMQSVYTNGVIEKAMSVLFSEAHIKVYAEFPRRHVSHDYKHGGLRTMVIFNPYHIQKKSATIFGRTPHRPCKTADVRKDNCSVWLHSVHQWSSISPRWYHQYKKFALMDARQPHEEVQSNFQHYFQKPFASGVEWCTIILVVCISSRGVW
jgi:hypothetical protein